MFRSLSARILGFAGFVLAYGALAAVIGVLAYQGYRWLHDGGWSPIGVGDGLRALLAAGGIKDGDAGRLAMLLRWLEAPKDWLGWHKVLEVIPASVGLFTLSVLGNFLYIYAGDLLRRGKEGA